MTCSSYSDDSVSVTSELEDGIASAPIQLNVNQVQDFQFETTGDATCILEGLNGDADLYLRWNDPPVTTGRPAYDCSSLEDGSNESCSVVNPGATTLWARVFAYQSFTDVVITCRTEAPPNPGCPPYSDAIPIEYDPNGLIIAGTTAGAPANLPDMTFCSTNAGSPTVFYKFTTAARRTIALTTLVQYTM